MTKESKRSNKKNDAQEKSTKSGTPKGGNTSNGTNEEWPTLAHPREVIPVMVPVECSLPLIASAACTISDTDMATFLDMVVNC